MGDGFVCLRVERSGGSEGRAYTLDLAATDASGNTGSASVALVVPHDRGHGDEACEALVELAEEDRVAEGDSRCQPALDGGKSATASASGGCGSGSGCSAGPGRRPWTWVGGVLLLAAIAVRLRRPR